MTRTFSRAEDRKAGLGFLNMGPGRGAESFGLLAVSVVMLCGLWLVYQAKTENPRKVAFDEVETQLTEKRIINLNEIKEPKDLWPALEAFDDPSDRRFTAEKIYEFVVRENRQIENVGALTQVRIEQSEVESGPPVKRLRDELAAARKVVEEKRAAGRLKAGEEERPLPLLKPQHVRDMKAALVVRGPEAFRQAYVVWCGLSLLMFYAIHLVWRARRFRGDTLILPLIFLLSGLGLILMVSLRDPLRDTLSFVSFAQGLLAGGAALVICSQLDWHRLTGKRTAWLALLSALALSALLLAFGTGPGTSDAKVNLFGLQPVEFIKLLAVFFLAKYFADRWEFLRERNQTGGGALSTLLRQVKIPALVYFLPVALGVGVVLFFFFLQKDLGPALVLSGTFLAMYAVARKRYGLVFVGLGILLAGVFVGYQLMRPETVYKRILINLDPWENALPNGDQTAHGFWALGTGGLTGTGLGMGDPSYIPAGHTDLVLASLGEELGFVGLLMIFVLYTLLIARCFVIALRARSRYAFFLCLGLTLITAFQLALIAGGILNLAPLSGVVTPFLSYGKSSMIANCIAFGIILAISSRRELDGELTEPFQRPLKHIERVFALIALALVCKAAYLQNLKADETVITPVLTRQGDGEYRYQYNPRIYEVIAVLPQGAVYDRNGLPLATSDWGEIERHRQDYAALGVDIDKACDRNDARYYPFGGRLFHILGDARLYSIDGVQARLNWTGRNYYVERDYAKRLKGYTDQSVQVTKRVFELDTKARQATPREEKVWRRDYSELLPLLRYRHRPTQSDAARLLNRERDVRLSIDARLQIRTADLLRQRVMAAGKENGAAIVLDAGSGDVLASVSYPWPDDREPPISSRRDSAENGEKDDPKLIDRARLELYPPGSTFKLVTAMAALRKNPQLVSKTFDCASLGGGWVGNIVKWDGIRQREIHDAKGDPAHGATNMTNGLIVSCNAYFAQLGTYEVGDAGLAETAGFFIGDVQNNDGIFMARPNELAELHKFLPDSSYGQGEVETTPFVMARVAATVANGGQAHVGRWVLGDVNRRDAAAKTVITADQAAFLARAMRGVVERGTATRLRNVTPRIAGKTGTAETGGPGPHAWFTGFAPYDGGRRIAFTVLIEKGGAGGSVAAPLAGEIVKAAGELGLLR